MSYIYTITNQLNNTTMQKWTIYLIPQNPFLFDGTVKKSILLSDSYQNAKDLALSIYPGYNIYNC